MFCFAFFRCSSTVANAYLLVCFDQLVESKQAAVPAAAALGLQVHADLVHDGGPAAREVVSDDGSKTHRQLGPKTQSLHAHSTMTLFARWHLQKVFVTGLQVKSLQHLVTRSNGLRLSCDRKHA